MKREAAPLYNTIKKCGDTTVVHHEMFSNGIDYLRILFDIRDMESKDLPYVGILKYELDGVTYYFIDNQEYFNWAVPYGDVRYDIEKFCFFDKAVLSMLKQIDFCPDIIH